MKNLNLEKTFIKKKWLIVKLEKIRILKNQIKIQIILNRDEKNSLGLWKNKILIGSYAVITGIQFVLQARYFKASQKINSRMILK